MPELLHETRIAIDGQTIRGDDWLSYSIKTSMIQPAGGFNFGLPYSPALWKLCRTDRRVKVTIDDAPVLDGFTSSRQRAHTRAGHTITITGYNKIGRLIAESAPAVDFRGLKASQLIGQLAAPQFTAIALSNTRNRDVARGRRGHKAKDSKRVFVDTKAGAGCRIEPGQSRWAAIQDIARQMGAVVHASADGRELVVGQPDSKQEIQYRFTPRNTLSITEQDSTDDRYSYYLILGAGAGTDANYGHPVSSRWGEAKDNPATTGGEGKDFSQPKRLVIADRHDLRSRDEARKEAELEQIRRNMKAHLVQIDAPGHGQIVATGAGRTLFTYDTIAAVQDDDAELDGRYLIVDCEYKGSREEGEATSLELMRAGQVLAA